MSDDTPARVHEEAFIQSFVSKDHRHRLVFELEKHRGRFLGRFCHNTLRYLDPRFVIAIPPPNSDPRQIQKLLLNNGAEGTCYAISSNDQLDGQILRLTDALAGTVGFGLPTILSCRPGLLAYIETEQTAGPPARYIVVRSPQSGH